MVILYVHPMDWQAMDNPSSHTLPVSWYTAASSLVDLLQPADLIGLDHLHRIHLPPQGSDSVHPLPLSLLQTLLEPRGLWLCLLPPSGEQRIPVDYWDLLADLLSSHNKPSVYWPCSSSLKGLFHCFQPSPESYTLENSQFSAMAWSIRGQHLVCKQKIKHFSNSWSWRS